RTTAPKKDDPQALVRTVEHQVALCRCGDAERSLARLRRADARLAAGLDERYTMACGLVGLGCLSEGGGADSR
ncbi:MAG: hypothetical protein KC620_10360, partial [Myxococcales bacterium]|nr:hypothetical protein [Myxococcales bacterium]